jgi:hypothetical protein
MEGILKFNLPEEETEFKMAVNVSNYFTTLWDMDQWLRSEIKYNDRLSEEEYKTFEKVREKLYVLLNENNITF